MKNSEKRIDKDGSVDNNPLNRDPLSGKPGAHPVGTGVGAAAGGAAGAAIGTAVAGPAGTVVGAVVGAVSGGLAGKAAGEKVNPTATTVDGSVPIVDTTFWRGQYVNEPYYEQGMTFDDYEPAYRTGISGYERFPGRSYEQVAAELERDYQINRGRSKLEWSRAEAATRAAWHHIERVLPGDADGDGR